jgi:hypothetical protein
MQNPSSLAALEPDAWAECRAHDSVMRYRRSGVGPAVLLLRAEHEPSPLWPELDHVLASNFRVILPAVSGSDMNIAACLGDFLEGIGVSGVAVIAAEPFCMPALELALRDVDQVSRVVLIPHGSADDAGLDGVLSTTARVGPVPLLVVRRDSPAAEALPLITRYLTGVVSPFPG